MTDTPAPRRFKVAPGRVVTLSLALNPGPGRKNLRYGAGDELELEAQRCTAQQRELAGRLRSGDLIEVPLSAAPVATPTAIDNVTPTRTPGGQMAIDTGAPVKE